MRGIVDDKSRKKKAGSGAGGSRRAAASGEKKTHVKADTAKAPGGSRKRGVTAHRRGAKVSRGREIGKIIGRLERAYPRSKIALRFANPLELLVATILAAQCTDERVNQVTSGLFEKYKRADDYSKASLDVLMEEIRPTGFFRNKSKSIQGACRLIVQKHGGVVPNTMEELIELPGVARKTANIVLGNAYGIASGIAVDTHMLRVSKRLGLTSEENPVKVERDLCQIVPRRHWIHFPHLIADHGRAVCKARSPLCSECVLRQLCPSRDMFTNRPRDPGLSRKSGSGEGRRRRA
jgi:endonuclease-3